MNNTEQPSQWITSARLVELLLSLPDGVEVTPNLCGNLSIQRIADKQWVGYVDCKHKYVEIDE